MTRKSFAYRKNLGGAEAEALMNRALSGVEATYQNIDNTEIGITYVDHYFEHLGGVSKAAEKRSGSRPKIYVSDSLAPATKIRSLEETVRLETRSRTLNPKWYEGMLRHGYQGVAEIEHAVTNTFGWSATADAVDDWVYAEMAETFVLDEKLFERLRQLNPHAARNLAARLIEAHDRGFWKTHEIKIEDLRRVLE